MSMGRRARRPYIFPLARPAGEGDKGGEDKKARLPVHAHAGKIAPAAAILCRTDVPSSAPQPAPHAGREPEFLPRPRGRLGGGLIHTLRARKRIAQRTRP